MQGGAVQGIGWALNEEYYMSDDGAMQNTSLLDYRMPTALDLPMIDTVIVEVAKPASPLRRARRGRGAAGTAARGGRKRHLRHAIGVRMYDLPMNPASIVKAIQSKNGG